MIDTLIAFYRALPHRPHCHAAIGTHTLACRLIMPLLRGPGMPPKPGRTCR